MSWNNKVIWSEGMFLRTQHFQQNDRYVESLVRSRVADLRPHPWGLSELEINRSLLSTGKFAVSTCRGVLADGTPFNIPEDVPHPEPLDLPENLHDCVVYLTLPVRQPGGVEVDGSGGDQAAARYHVEEYEAVDSNSGSDTVAQLRIGKLRLKYMLATDERGGYLSLGLARVVEVKADRTVVLDESYIPSCLDCMVSGVLANFLTELVGLFHHRGEALAARVVGSGTKGVAEVADFLLLQVVNRLEPLLAHMATGAAIHPERFFCLGLEIAGELATFTSPTKRPPQFPIYKHDDLESCFAPLIAELRQSLSAVLEQTAIAIELQERRYGIHVATIPDRALLTRASFVLAVKADIPMETLRRNFPNQAKIGPVEQIRELVNVALPGVPVRALPVAPRQIPYHAGVSYFELDRSSQYWKQMGKSGGLALHVAGDFPGLQLELWAIKE
ncbi:MAG: type VI secretion system baseplate subunit TssK [Alphaproteobacteria bacterium]